MSLSVAARGIYKETNIFFPLFYSSAKSFHRACGASLKANATQTTKVDLTAKLCLNHDTIKRSFCSNAHSRFNRKFSCSSPNLLLQKIETTPIKDISFQLSIPNKDLSAIGGYKEELAYATDLFRYLKNPINITGNKAPKGIILSGPPGVGKTFIAEAIAGQAGVPLIVVNAPEIAGELMDKPGQILQNLWEKAKKSAPCVIFFDTFESIASKRIFDDSQSLAYRYNAMVNQVLLFLSLAYPGVVIIASTNHFEKLDPAIMRPGRFNRHIPLSLPNENDRMHILEILLNERQISSDLVLDELVAISTGFSGAKLTAWVNEAAHYASQEACTQIHLRHFDQARDQLDGVIPKDNSSLQGKDQAASHEAGHAVVGYLLKHKLYKITIHGDEHSRGRTEWLFNDAKQNPTKQDLLDTICMCLAGRAAEEVFLKTLVIGSESDLKSAKTYALKIVEEGMGSSLLGNEADVEHILQHEMARARDLLKKNQQIWEWTRDALLQNKVLFRSDFLKIITGETLT